ncbi:2-hydroxyglutaryl-CoA dehydratase [Candidatus Clostridium stratigraminis]|uniref:2-hydroxyglutaryl-CoA dehydratase n=1 Tax=Candidatus Clostridium stratigraminis TaxID=3381661 RepID=A0ABW8T6C3_9CLOT
MKITFPHLGNVNIAAKALFSDLGIDYIMPPLNSCRSLEIGSSYSPEEICLPFKLMIGNYIESIKLGADTVLLTGSCGPCRFGEYCELQMNLLNKLGYNLDFIVLDQPSDIGVNELLCRLNKIKGASKKNFVNRTAAVINAIKINSLMDKFEADLHYMAGFEKNRGDCRELLKELKNKLINCPKAEDMKGIIKEYFEKLNNIEIDKSKEPLKIAIIGEIYTIIEPFANMYIEDKLMEYGICSKRKLSPSWWVKDTLLSPLKLDSLAIKNAGRDYLKLGIGGYAQECIGEAMLAKREGFDGAIQVMPLGCMPEIVSKSILPAISQKENFPIMSLVIDEMTGEAGYITRLEAFIDLLERRRENVFSRN